MKKEELMIGDWVYNTHNCKAEQVQYPLHDLGIELELRTKEGGV